MAAGVLVNSGLAGLRPTRSNPRCCCPHPVQRHERGSTKCAIRTEEMFRLRDGPVRPSVRRRRSRPVALCALTESTGRQTLVGARPVVDAGKEPST